MEAYKDYINTLQEFRLPQIPYRENGNYKEEPLLEYVVRVVELMTEVKPIRSTQNNKNYPLIIGIDSSAANIFAERLLNGNIDWSKYFFAECMDKEKGLISDATLFAYEVYMRKLELDKLLYLGLWLDDYIKELKPFTPRTWKMKPNMIDRVHALFLQSKSIDFNIEVNGKKIKKTIKWGDELYATLGHIIGVCEEDEEGYNENEELNWDNLNLDNYVSYIKGLPNTKRLQMYVYREIMDYFIPSIDENRKKEVESLLPSCISINRDKFKFAASLLYVLGINININDQTLKNTTNDLKYGRSRKKAQDDKEGYEDVILFAVSYTYGGN